MAVTRNEMLKSAVVHKMAKWDAQRRSEAQGYMTVQNGGLEDAV